MLTSCLVVAGCTGRTVRQVVGQMEVERIESLEVAGLESDGITVDMSMIFLNPTDVSATLESMTYVVYFDGERFGAGTYDRYLVVPPNNRFKATLRVNSPYAVLGPSLVAALGQDSVSYKIDTTIKMSGWTSTFNGTLNGRIALGANLGDMVAARTREIGIGIDRVEVTQIGAEKAQLAIDLTINNPFPVTTQVVRGRYELVSGETILGRGKIVEARRIRQGAGTSVKTLQDVMISNLSRVIIQSMMGEIRVKARGRITVQVLGQELDVPFQTAERPLTGELLRSFLQGP